MSRRSAGPPQPMAVRNSGDPVWGKQLEEALAMSGPVDRHTHRFHTYPARMHPDAASVLIAACPGAVHDPFCGGGTVLVEAMLAGRLCTGIDLSPIALLVSRARVAGPGLAGPLRRASRALAKAAQLRVDVEVPEIAAEWFEPHVAQEIGRLREGICQADSAVQPVLWAVLSSILVKASYRESDTSNQRRPYHRPPGTTAILFHKRARELGRALETLPDTLPPIVIGGDARVTTVDPTVGFILTSPPYPGVYDYVPMHQLRYAWLDIDAQAGKADEIGTRRSFRAKGRREALKQWRKDTARWVRCQSACLVDGGYFAIFVGDGLVGDKPVDTLGPTVDALREAGLTIVARASADRPDHARASVRIEHLVLAQKTKK
jgi:hypothetical protein